MGREIEKYPKLVQKFALQPHLFYDLMCVCEENCLDLLLNDELVSFNRSQIDPGNLISRRIIWRNSTL